MLYCVAAHQDKISDQCQGALVDAAMILADLTDRIVTTARPAGRSSRSSAATSS